MDGIVGLKSANIIQVLDEKTVFFGLKWSTFSSMTSSILAKYRYINKYGIGIGREKNFSIGVRRKDRPPKNLFVLLMVVNIDHFLKDLIILL